jgi:hypothetical protein
VNPINAVLRVLGFLAALLMAYGLRPHFLAGIEPELADRGAPKAAILPLIALRGWRDIRLQRLVRTLMPGSQPCGWPKNRLSKRRSLQSDGQARSAGMLSRVFQVLDVFESHFQVKELCSRRITKSIQRAAGDAKLCWFSTPRRARQGWKKRLNPT